MFLIKIFDAILETIQWLIGYNQRQIGKEEQQNCDRAETIDKLKAEQAARIDVTSAADQLRKHDL